MLKLEPRPPARFFSNILLVILLWGGASPVCARTANAEAKRQELKHLRARIKHVRQELRAKMNRRGELTRRLRASEQNIAHLTAKIKRTKTNLARAHRRLKHLQAVKAQARAALSREKSALKKSIVASYMAGREERLKLLLNQQNPARLGRVLVYYDYFRQARSERIQSVRSHLAKLRHTNTQIRRELDRQRALKQTHKAALSKLQTTRVKRTRLLAEVNTAISRQSTKLERMHQNEKALRELLDSLSRTLYESSPNIQRGTAFSKFKSKLSWPIQGQILAGFGAPVAGGRLRRHSVLIAAPRGTPVHAISYGRVIYAGWLAHFGLLVIIDHGDGYMSLYGHNQSIYTRVGDKVKPGAVIASLGESGGQSKPALYFEIRHNKTPLDPSHWCHGKLAKR